MFQGGFPAAERPNLSRKRAHQRGNCPDYIIEGPEKIGARGSWLPESHEKFRAPPARNFCEKFKIIMCARRI